jgi:hypothetical protein
LPNNFKEIADKAFEIADGKDPETKNIVLVKDETFDVDMFTGVLLFSIIKLSANKRISSFYVTEKYYESNRFLINLNHNYIDRLHSSSRCIALNNESRGLVFMDKINPNDKNYFWISLNSRNIDIALVNDSDLLTTEDELELYRHMGRSNCNGLCIYVVGKDKKDQLLSRFDSDKYYLFEIC